MGLWFRMQGHGLPGAVGHSDLKSTVDILALCFLVQQRPFQNGFRLQRIEIAEEQLAVLFLE